MESLDELNEAVKAVIESGNRINEEVNEMIFTKAPLVIHQRLCSELVKIMKDHPSKTASEIPKVMELLTAITILKGLYPQLNQ